MKKIALTLLLLVVIGIAADASYLKGFPILNDSTWIKKGDVHYTSHYIDTMTVKATNPAKDTIIDFGITLYNVRLKSINAPTDSGAMKVSLAKGIWNVDSVAHDLAWRAVGGTGAAAPDSTSYLYFGPIGLRYLKVRPVVGSGVVQPESTIKIRVEGWR